MRNLHVCFVFLALIAISDHGSGQPAPSIAPAPPNPPKLESVRLYNGAQGLTAASLLPLQVQDPLQNECKGKKESGVVSFSFIVDAAGRARNIVFDHVLGNAMDYLAVRVMEADRFQAATLNGVAVAVGEAMKMRLELCAEAVKKQGGGAQGRSYRLRALPQQELVTPPQTQDEVVLAPIPDPQAAPAPPEKVGNGVTAPHLLNSPEAEFSDYARRNKIQGECKFSMVVDEHGLPQDIKIVTPMEASLLENAYEVIRQYRFKPGAKDGAPVRVQIEVTVDFKLY
jgi:TonB family protein